MYLVTKSLVHLTPLKAIVISTKDGCPTLLANDGYFGQACTLKYFYSCLFYKFKLIKGANKVVVVVVVVVVTVYNHFGWIHLQHSVYMAVAFACWNCFVVLQKKFSKLRCPINGHGLLHLPSSTRQLIIWYFLFILLNMNKNSRKHLLHIYVEAFRNNQGPSLLFYKGAVASFYNINSIKIWNKTLFTISLKKGLSSTTVQVLFTIHFD